MSDIYTLTITEELKYIDNINNNLSLYQNTLITNFEEKSTVINGFFICELMINLIIKKEGNTQNITFSELCKKNELIPIECSDFLSIIRYYRDTMIDAQELKESIIPFLKAFNYFIIWFDEYYKNKYHYIKRFNIKECYDTINSIIVQKEKICPECGLEIPDDSKFCIHCGASLKKHEMPKIQFDGFYESKTLKKRGFNYNFNKYGPKSESVEKDIILEKLKEQNELLLELLKKVNNIDNKIDYIINEITTLQSYTEKLIKNVRSDAEIDNIINAYTDQCIENIYKNYILINDDQNYNLEKRKLIYTLGENAWNKLSEKSQTFLITSKIMFNKLIMMNEVIDYSGICVLITKALEVEINKRFFTDFIKYLDNTYNKDYSIYPTPLLFNKKEPLYSDKITLGNFQFILCLKEDRYANPNEKKNNEEKLLEYSKNCIFSKFEENKIKYLLNYYAVSIEEIRVKYRNPSAHTNEIKRVDAEECFNLVLDIEKLLKKMLDSFDY